MNNATIKTRIEGNIGFLQLHRPKAMNAINTRLIAECDAALTQFETYASVVVIEGLPDVFCSGADFKEVVARADDADAQPAQTGPLYDLWIRLSESPMITVAHVQGRVHAGGIGFVAACDLALADTRSKFSLSDMLFGVPPACVFPFLIRRVGVQRARYLTLTTSTIDASGACDWGLIDACSDDSERLLQRVLTRLRHLSQPAIARYKRCIRAFDEMPHRHRAHALASNREAFTDPVNLASWRRFTERGLYPWEADPV